jgi:AraC-like DNA-binding protein
MTPEPTEHARFIRPPDLTGVEALHATFVSHRYMPHIHEAWTIAHMLSGAARFELEGRWHTAPAGTSVLIPPGAVHTGESAIPAGYSYRVLYLEPPRLNDLSEHAVTPRRRATPVVIRTNQLARALTVLHVSLTQHGMILEQGEALSRVRDVLLELLGSPDMPTHRNLHPAIAAARSYIHEHWHEDFSLDELARIVGLSAFHLVRIFHDQIGAPPSAYRRALRVQAAQRFLRAGTSPARAAAECGFYDQAHLNRHFKRVTGVTPSQYVAATT